MAEKTLTLGSLFSGSGGFELAGILAGIEPLWSSEVEPCVSCAWFLLAGIVYCAQSEG